MRMSTGAIFVSIVAIVGICLRFVLPATAALPPQYTTWADFAAVVDESSIPRILGVVDRIERRQDGTFVVRAGPCFLEVTVIRESFTAPDGRPYVGGTHVTKVNVGEKRCN
jgi:hypothetical protein